MPLSHITMERSLRVNDMRITKLALGEEMPHRGGTFSSGRREMWSPPLSFYVLCTAYIRPSNADVDASFLDTAWPQHIFVSPHCALTFKNELWHAFVRTKKKGLR